MDCLSAGMLVEVFQVPRNNQKHVSLCPYIQALAWCHGVESRPGLPCNHRRHHSFPRKTPIPMADLLSRKGGSRLGDWHNSPFDKCHPQNSQGRSLSDNADNISILPLRVENNSTNENMRNLRNLLCDGIYHEHCIKSYLAIIVIITVPFTFAQRVDSVIPDIGKRQNSLKFASWMSCSDAAANSAHGCQYEQREERPVHVDSIAK